MGAGTGDGGEGAGWTGWSGGARCPPPLAPPLTGLQHPREHRHRPHPKRSPHRTRRPVPGGWRMWMRRRSKRTGREARRSCKTVSACMHLWNRGCQRAGTHGCRDPRQLIEETVRRPIREKVRPSAPTAGSCPGPGRLDPVPGHPRSRRKAGPGPGPGPEVVPPRALKTMRKLHRSGG